eukprot:scaffold24585_cov56-Phaeocystis_antarctica.AAC.1
MILQLHTPSAASTSADSCAVIDSHRTQVAYAGLPAGRKPRRHAVKETSRGSQPPFPCPALRLPPLPPRQQIRHARPAQRTAARGAALYTGDATLAAAGGVALCGCGAGGALWQLANGDPACGGTSDGGRAARRVALSAGIRSTTRAARTVREYRRVRSGSIQS